MARPAGIEPTTPWFEARYSIQLSYRRKKNVLNFFKNKIKYVPMNIIVQKYGGTSLGSIERINNVASRIKKWASADYKLVIVVSAMSVKRIC